MPDLKSLTEAGWKAVVQKNKLKDNGLQKALATYEGLKEQQFDERLKCLASICQLANALKKVKEVAASLEVIKYLGGVVSAADAAKNDITKAAAAAAKLAADAKKKEAADAKNQDKDDEEEEEDEEEEGDYKVLLLAAFQKLKTTKDLVFQFIVCDAKPCAVMVAKKITSKHKLQLTELTNSKRFLPLGTCHFADGKYNFTMEKPVSGLARKLQEAIKVYTGKKLPIIAGTETADDGEDQPGAPEAAAAGGSAASGAGAAKAPPPALAQAPEAWHKTRQDVERTIGQLKDAIRKEFADQGGDLIADIEKNMTKLDAVLDKLDARLADSLDKARAATDAAARSAELKNSKTVLADYIKYVKAEPLITHIDSNPFGVKTNLRQTLATSLTQMAQAIGS